MNAEIARSLWLYDPETGLITWKECRWRIKAGTPAGYVKYGYLVLTSSGNEKHFAHRVAWLITHGEWPRNEIDHINGDKLDNRLSNLRDVTHAVNMRNRRDTRVSGASAGVRSTQSGRYSAQIKRLGACRHLGTFDSRELARAAFEVASKGGAA